MIQLRLATLLAALMLLLQAGGVAGLQVTTPEPPVPVSTRTDIDFPQGMSFAADIPMPFPGSEVEVVQVVQIIYRIASDPTLNLEIVPETDYVIEDGSLRVDTFIDFLSGFTPVGVELTFSWEVVLADGAVVATADETTSWMDNRFDWDERSSNQIRLRTYETSDDFAEMMLEESQATIDALESTYGLDAISPLTIWVYPSYEDFKGTLQGNAREAIAGVTYPGMDTMVVIVPDGDVDEFGRVIPHEISHQVLFAATENAYGPAPLWFDEGIATHTQIGGTDTYAGMVANALEDNALFDIRSLEASFPYGPAQATLAYASSWSMISYIEERWGPEGISRLIDAFAEGMPVEDAVPAALEISLDELDDAWKAWIKIND